MAQQDGIGRVPPFFLTPGGPPVLLGRFATPSGGIVDTALATDALRKAMSGTSDTSLIGLMRTAERLLVSDRPAGDRPIAFVAIGFGSPSRLPWAPEWGKGDFDPDKHPRWPSGAPDSEGGRFRPNGAGEAAPLSVPPIDPDKMPAASESEAPGMGHNNSPTLNNPATQRGLDEASDAAIDEAASRAERAAARRVVRSAFMDLIKGGYWGFSSLLPKLFLPLEILEIINAIEETKKFAELHPDIMAADEFLRDGPYTVDDLRMSRGANITFHSFGDFKKTDETELDKRYKAAGPGWSYHHIVPQGGANAATLTQEQLNSTENIVRIPNFLHEKITAYYNSKIDISDLRNRGLSGLNIPDQSMKFQEWIQTQPYDVQLRIGIQIMRSFFIVK